MILDSPLTSFDGGDSYCSFSGVVIYVKECYYLSWGYEGPPVDVLLLLGSIFISEQLFRIFQLI